MSTVNTALLYSLGQDLYMHQTREAGASGVRNSAPRLPTQVTRVTFAGANGSFVLPSILNQEDYQLMWVINDSLQTIVVSAAPSETVNGVASTSNLSAGILSIPAGQSGVFVPVTPEVGTGTPGDWRAAIVS